MARTGMVQQVLKGEKAAPARDKQKPVKPTALAAGASLVLAVIGVLLAFFVDAAEEFKPRVETLDALAGLAVGAFVVERLLNFAPPLLAYGARGNPREPAAAREQRVKQRAADVAFVRVGYGVLFGGLFVMATDLRAVKVLSPEGAPETVSADTDRVIAALAIAGGVAGLANLLSGLNPQPKTDPEAEEKTKDANNEADVVPPPSDAAYVVGIAAVLIAAAIALFGAGDKTGLELITPSEQADGSVGLVVRFGTVILVAGVIQQIVERLVYPFVEAAEHRKIVTGAVSLVLGVAAARSIDLFLLHDIGFFGVGANETINDGLSASTDAARWFDTFVTGVAIAAGTKPLHDLSAGIKKRTEKKDGTTGAVPA